MNSNQVKDSTPVVKDSTPVVKDSTPVVKKTIPKKTMGYLKFAYWALHQPGDNIQKLFLDRSIDEIIHHVSQIVDHGDQHITINTLHKNLRHLINPKKSKAKAESKSKAEPKSKPEPKAKPESKSKAESKSAPDLPDTIVTQLVTLARQDFNTTHETLIGETIPAILKNKKPRAKKYITPTEHIVEPIIEPLIEPIVESLIEPIVETPSETFAETPAQTIKKHRPTPIKKIKVKQYATFEHVSPTLQLSQELFP